MWAKFSLIAMLTDKMFFEKNANIEHGESLMYVHSG